MKTTRILTPRLIGLADHQINHIKALYRASQHTLGPDSTTRKRRFVSVLRIYYSWESYERRVQIFDAIVRPLDVEYMTKVHAKRLCREHNDDVQDLFGTVDVDGSGSIDLTEFRRILERCHKNKMSSEEIEAMFHKADKDGNGTLDPIEFYSMVASTPRLRRVFDDVMDTARTTNNLRAEMRRARIFKTDVSTRRPSLSDIRASHDVNISDIPLDDWLRR